MSTVEKLLCAAENIWTEYSRHSFVKGIEDGTLDKEKFKYYIIQDYFYLTEYAKVFGVGIAKAKNMETLKLFSSYVHVLTEGEMDIHKGYMARLGITNEEISGIKPAFDNIAYTSYMLRVAYEEGEAEILAAILSCAYSYEVIAREIAENNPQSVNHPFYGEWVRGYISKEYSEENKALMGMLDRLTENYSEKQIKHLEDIFVVCSRYELHFWNMAWSMSK